MSKKKKNINIMRIRYGEGELLEHSVTAGRIYIETGVDDPSDSDPTPYERVKISLKGFKSAETSFSRTTIKFRANTDGVSPVYADPVYTWDSTMPGAKLPYEMFPLECIINKK